LPRRLKTSKRAIPAASKVRAGWWQALAIADTPTVKKIFNRELPSCKKLDCEDWTSLPVLLILVLLHQFAIGKVSPYISTVITLIVTIVWFKKKIPKASVEINTKVLSSQNVLSKRIRTAPKKRPLTTAISSQ